MPESIITNVAEMIDLAIGSPEVGVVDFNMLQSVLHCIAQQLRIRNKSVELIGGAVPVPVPSTKENVQTIAIDEYILELDKDSKAPTKSKAVSESAPPPPAGRETILVVDRVRKQDYSMPIPIQTDTTVYTAITTGGRPSQQTQQGRESQAGQQRQSTVSTAQSERKSQSEPGAKDGSAATKTTSLEKLSLVTMSKFNILENVVDDLKNRVYGSMPKNETILEEVRSQTNLKAITDMWTSLNVSSRLEAAEAGINKLSSLVQDLIGELANRDAALETVKDLAQDAAKDASAAKKVAASAKATAAKVVTTSSDGGGGMSEAVSAVGSEAGGDDGAGASDLVLTELEGVRDDIRSQKDELRRLKEDLRRLRDEHGRLVADVTGQPVPDYTTHRSSSRRAESTSSRHEAATTTPRSSTPTPYSAVQAETGSVPQGVSGKSASLSSVSPAVMQRIAEIERKLDKCNDIAKKVEGVVGDQLSSFQEQLEHLQKDFGFLNDSLSSGKLSPDLIKDLQGLFELMHTVQVMQGQLQQVHEFAEKLAAEKTERQHHLNVLLEQIELLKTIKLDREDMIEAMADKADLRLLARKVSHDQFEMACEDLSRGLDHALGKLSVQEALWQQALDDIQREIQNKLDKMELSPVKEFFNNKLRQLQENLKQMADLRREVEAAGTKKRLLRDVNCISCDANAVMVMDPQIASSSKPMHATMSIKPYLAYELDTIRKQNASGMQQRNMHDWEAIERQMAQQQKPPVKVRSDTDKHICNRYCGGSHTTTTAAQRVARMGHFMKQWGPDVVPLSTGLAAGDDGRLYKVSLEEAPPTTAQATKDKEGHPPSPHVPEPCRPKKLETIKAPNRGKDQRECHCLD